MPGLAVIIPCLNEELHLPATLKALKEVGLDFEIIVVDGGSCDETVSLAREQGCTVITSDRPQRARQLNLGARAAIDHGADVLLFLHADTRIKPVAIKRMMAKLEQPDVIGGAFYRRFDSPSLYLRWSSWVADLRARFWNIFYGDQAIFVRRSIFEVLGGYDESLDVAEDLDFSLRLREEGRVVALGPRVVASARRFDKLGPRPQVLQDRAFVKGWMRERGWRDWQRGRR